MGYQREFSKLKSLNQLYLSLNNDLDLKGKLLNIYRTCENEDFKRFSCVQRYWLQKLLTPKILGLINIPESKRNVISFYKKQNK